MSAVASGTFTSILPQKPHFHVCLCGFIFSALQKESVPDGCDSIFGGYRYSISVGSWGTGIVCLRRMFSAFSSWACLSRVLTVPVFDGWAPPRRRGRIFLRIVYHRFTRNSIKYSLGMILRGIFACCRNRVLC